MRHRTYRIVGVSFRNDDGTDHQSILKDLYDDWWTEDRETEMQFRLVLEPDNQYDSNAIAVVFTSEGRVDKVGYISKDDNIELGEAISIGYVDGTARLESMGLAKNGNVALALDIGFYDDTEIQHDSTGRIYYYAG